LFWKLNKYMVNLFLSLLTAIYLFIILHDWVYGFVLLPLLLFIVVVVKKKISKATIPKKIYALPLLSLGIFFLFLITGFI